jgi:uncharacterized protein (UPF0335 family)
MATIEELEQQKAEIEKQISQVANEKKKEDLRLVRQLCRRHGFTYNALKNHLSEGRTRNN